MNDALRAETLHELATLELQAIENLMRSHEQLHDLLNDVYRAFGLPPHSYDEAGVNTTRFANEIREYLIALESK